MSIPRLRPLILLGIGFSWANAQAASPQPLCSSLFVAPEKVTAADLLITEGEWEKSGERWQIPPGRREQVEYAYGRLARMGVNSHVMRVLNVGHLPRYEIEISPVGNSALNTFAALIKEKYGTALTFDPYILDRFGVAAGTSDENDRIYLPRVAAFTGQPNVSLRHEFSHLMMTDKEKKGEASLINGNYRRGWTKWPTGQYSQSGYDSNISAQELATWYSTFHFRLSGARQLFQAGRITQKNFIEVVATTARFALQVIDDVLSLAQYEFTAYQEGKGRIEYDEDAKSFFIQIRKWPFFEGNHMISRAFYKDHLSPEQQKYSNDDLADFFEDPAQRPLLRTIAIDYIRRFRDEAQSIHDDVERYTNLEQKVLEEVSRLRSVTKDDAERDELLKQFLLRL